MTRGDGIPQQRMQQDGIMNGMGADWREPVGEQFGNTRERAPDTEFRADANEMTTMPEESPMRFVPTAVHGAMDYPMAILTMASPWIFGFRKGGMETWMPVAVGGMSLVVNAMSDHELGIAKMIPMRVHAMLDVMNGAMLAASPWMFGFARSTMLPHLMLGAMDLVSGMTVKTKPSLKYRQA